MLKISNISKKFGDIKVLDDISLEVEKSSILGLAGPSGGGKSTLLRCLQRLEMPDSGVIDYDSKTAFMFQDFQLFPHISVIENLTYAPAIHNKNLNHIIKANELLDQLGIAEKANEYPHNLSGGQKQRVALARSLMIEPEVLLCDEPTSGLDVSTIMDVVNLLKSIRSLDVTMIIASHDLDFLTKISDRIVLLKEGKIIVDIKPNQVQDSIEYLRNFY